MFLDRYHMEILKSPRQTRNCLAYVLQNARRHGDFVPDSMGGADGLVGLTEIPGGRRRAARA